jgi:hypothetical protein
MPPVAPVPDHRDSLKELVDFQSSMYEKASTYTKVIIGLGYGGFFAVWSGTKQHLSPKALVGSALFETVSLVLFIVFEIWQAMVMSYLSIEFANTVKNRPTADVSEALQTHKRKTMKLMQPLFSAWKIVFPVSALTGLVGAGILIYAFIGSLYRMWP